MTATRRLFGFLLCFGLAMSQVSPTRIGQHQIGETLQDWYLLEPNAKRDLPASPIAPHVVGETVTEWLNLNQMDLGAICGNHQRSDRSMDFKAVCKKLSTIRETGRGEFYTASQFATFGWRFVEGKVSDYSIDGKWQSATVEQVRNIGGTGNELVTKHDERSYAWKFSDGKLSEVSVTPDWDAIYKQYSEEGIARHPEVVPRFQQEVEFLIQTYGKPSKIEAVPYGNAFGAHWERSMVVWHAPDGTLITAFERTELNQQGQLQGVVFQSKDSAKRTEQSKPNPYTR